MLWFFSQPRHQKQDKGDKVYDDSCHMNLKTMLFFPLVATTSNTRFKKDVFCKRRLLHCLPQCLLHGSGMYSFGNNYRKETGMYLVNCFLLQEFIPYMAKEYGFQYELVQYKWPRWLHQQTEKQRIIWGYKILFLDVLFPLAVDKILFVDADQVEY